MKLNKHYRNRKSLLHNLDTPCSSPHSDKLTEEWKKPILESTILSAHSEVVVGQRKAGMSLFRRSNHINPTGSWVCERTYMSM